MNVYFVLFMIILPIITIRLFNYTTSSIITFVPDLGKLIIPVPLVLVTIGIVKLVLLVSFYRKEYKVKRINS